MITSTVGPRREVAARADLAGSSLSIQDELDAIPAGALVVDEEGVMLAVNAEIARQFGYEPRNLLGQSVEMLVPSRRRRGHTAMRSGVITSGKMRAMGPGRVLQGQRKSGAVFPIEVGLRSVSRGNSKFVLAVVSDRTDQVRAQEMEAHGKTLTAALEYQEVVAREMAHRVKNLIATIVALISLSARGAQSAKEMEESLRGRVLALSSVIDLAFKADRGSAAGGTLSIEDILRAVLAPFMWTHLETDRIRLSGPRLVVGQRPSEVLALVFHELMTNAVKYGGLSQPDGRILVDWRRSGGRLELRWREQAPRFKAAVSPREGFGTNLISRLIEAEFGGRIERDITKLGWAIRISIPLPSAGL